MKRSAFISDLIFSFFSACLFTLGLFRFWKINLLPALFLALLCGALTTAAVGAYLQNKRKTVFLKHSDEKEKEKLLLHLAFLSDEGKMQFFLPRLSSPEMPAKRSGRFRLYTDDAFYFLRFSIAPVTSDEILQFARLKTSKTKFLLCSKIEESAYALANRFGIKTLTGEQVYTLLKEKNALPEQYLCDDEPKQKRRLHIWLAKANAKRFLIASAFVLLTAFLSPFPYYYFLFSALLLLSAVFIRIFGYQ